MNYLLTRNIEATLPSLSTSSLLQAQKKPLNEGLFNFLKRNDSKKRVETDQPALLASLVKLDFLLEALLA